MKIDRVCVSMKHKKDRYSGYRRSSSRERSDASRRRSSRSRRDSYSGKDKDDYRSMTRSRSREDSRRKTWRRSRSSRSRSYSSSSSGSSSSSSRSRSRSRKPSPRPLHNGSKDRNTAKDKNFPPLNLPLGRIGENSQFPSDSNSMQWFDQRPPYPRQTPDPPPPPSLGGSVPPPPPAPSFDNQPIPSYQGGPEQRQYPPPNFPEQNFGGNYQENYQQYGSTYYQGVNSSFPSQGPPNQQHNYGIDSGPPPTQPNMSGSNWDNLGFPNVMPPHPGVPPNQHPHGFKGSSENASASHSDAYENSKKEAVEQELAQQKRTLAVQREEYFKRKIALTRELNRLKDQKRDLLKEDSKENDRILKENSKLQSEIIQKLESMDNVIEMLSNIIGDKAEIAELMKETSFVTENTKKIDKRKRSGSRSPHKKSEKGRSSSPFEKAVNIIHYDPEIHWCSACDIFPRTAVEYLSHLHAEDHKKMVATKKNVKEEDIAPWRVTEPREASPPTFKNATNKKVPIRGLQFLVPSTAWYCTLCKVWIGDGDIANRHLRGQKHASNYREFISKNPHYEVDWLTERTKAYEKNSDAKLRTKTEKLPKNESTLKPAEPTLATPPPSFDIGNLGDRLLAMIAASSKLNAKEKRRSISDSSKSSSNDSDNVDKKKDRKKKKKKKSQKKEESGKQKEEEFDEKQRKKKKDELQKKGFMKETLNKKEMEYERKDKKGGIMKGRNYDEEEEDSESNQVKIERKGRFGELEWNRQKKFGRWNVEPSDRNYRQGDKTQQPSGFSRSGSKNVQAGPDFLSKDFHGPAPCSPKRSLSQHKTVFYGPKAPPKRGGSKDKALTEPDKKIGKGRLFGSGRIEEESTVETVFEKKTSESAAKKKEVKKMSFAMPKSKLPFIGRMPILKKKVEVKPEAAEKEAVQSQKENPIEPVEIPLELQSEIPDPQNSMESHDEPPHSAVDSTLPKSTLIISKRPRLGDTELGRKEIVKIKTTDDNLQEQDMEIEDEPHKEESVVKDELVVEEIEVPPAKDELHKDFKDALDLLFPEEKPEGEDEEPVPAVVSESEQVAQSTTSAPPQAYGLIGWPQPHQGMEQHPYPMHYDQNAYMQHVPYMTPMGYEQQPHPGMYGMPPGEYLDPTISQHPSIPQTHEQIPPPIQTLPPDNTIPAESQEEPPGKDDDAKPEGTPSPVVKRNPPGQRLRRHLKKKAMMEAEKKKLEEEKNALKSSSSKMKSDELSELAMLGIEEDDITAQNFF